jgi:mannosyltransferase PIG-V
MTAVTSWLKRLRKLARAGTAADRSRALGALALSRAVAWGAGGLAIAIWGMHANAGRFDPDHVARGPWAYWDSVWFLEIARHGYDRAEDAAFFPLYPLLLKATGASVAGGVLVSLACLAGALWLLHRLVALDFGAPVAGLTVLLVALFPASAYFSAVYSESLFLLLSVAAVYAARTDRWALAGLAGALATGTRSAGIVLLVPLALLWWRSPRRRPLDAAWLAVVPLGLVTFCAYLGLSGEDALGPFRAQDSWNRALTWPLGGAWEGAQAAWEGARQLLAGEPRTWPVYDTAWLDVGLFATLVLALVAAAGAVRRLPPAYSLYAVAALALPLTFPADQPLMSLPRFVAVLWPLHLWAAVALIERAGPRRAVLAASAVGLALVSGEVSTWGWVA